MTLTERLQTLLIGRKYAGTEVSERQLTEIIGRPVKWYDTCIDDGADDESEDEYVMKACYSTEDDKVVIRIYYGDATREIGYVDVDEPVAEEL